MITVPAYLIGLGLARVTARMDPHTQVVWESDDTIHLIRDGTIHDERDYLLHRWEPSAVTSPWNGGGGYDGDKYLEAVETSSALRLAPLRSAIACGRKALALGLEKEALIRAYRASIADEALDWIDACWAEMSDDRLLVHPLLGSGGNDGRLDFSRTYLRALGLVMDMETGQPTRHAARWLDFLLGLASDPGKPIQVPGGQFFAGQIGGYNAGPGFVGDGSVNPWAYLLAIEGCMMFGGGAWRHDPAVRYWPNTGKLSAVGLHIGTEADASEAQEMWWPVWRTPLSVPEIRSLLSGQQLYKFGRTVPRDGLEYCIAAASCERPWLGEVLRVSRLARNGFAHFLTVEDVR